MFWKAQSGSMLEHGSEQGKTEPGNLTGAGPITFGDEPSRGQSPLLSPSDRNAILP